MLTCIRADGSHTWNRFTGAGRAMIAHDLLHFAVETTLGFSGAFYGLVANGWDIPSFTRPGATRQLPPEAVQTEVVVGLLQTGVHTRAGEEEMFFQMLRAACANAGIEPPSMTMCELAAIRTLADELLARFGALDEGSAMELRFPAPAVT